MIPPNVAPPKTIIVNYPGAEDKIRKQYVYETFLSTAEVQQTKLVPGNRLIVKFREEIVGEGQAILVEPTNLEKLTPYDAMIGGYETVDALKKDVLQRILKDAKRAAETPFIKVLFRWL